MRITSPARASKNLPPLGKNDDFEATFLAEFLSHERSKHDAVTKADLLNFTNLPGSTVHPAFQRAKLNKKSALNNVAGKFSGIPDHERRRFDELSKKKTSTKAKQGHQKKLFAPYVEANSKISRVLQHKKPRSKAEDMQASQLNDFYKLVARETAAAIVLQSHCRRIMDTKLANKKAHEMRQATKIQSSIRAYFARQLLRRLKEETERATNIREQCIRLHVARIRRRKRIKLEHDSAIICQSTIRMFFAKRVAHLLRLQQSWEINQQRWRAISTRLAWADLRINFYARQIQSVVRRKLAKRRVSAMFAVHTKSAILIQSVWRRYISQQQKDEIMYQQNVDHRSDKIRLLMTEHKYWKQRLEELTKPSKLQVKQGLDDQKEVLEKARSDKYEQIHALECHYRDQLQVQQQITPRAIAGGWEEQVKVNLKDTRERITRAKLDLFFDIEMKLKAVTNKVETIQRGIDEAKARSRRAW